MPFSQAARLGRRAGTIGELFSFLWQRKLWWIVPLFAILLLLGLLMALAQTSAVAPWMYPLLAAAPG